MKEQKRVIKNKRERQAKAIGIILNLLVATIAFAFILNMNLGVVSGEDGWTAFKSSSSTKTETYYMKGGARYEAQSGFFYRDGKIVGTYDVNDRGDVNFWPQQDASAAAPLPAKARKNPNLNGNIPPLTGTEGVIPDVEAFSYDTERFKVLGGNVKDGFQIQNLKDGSTSTLQTKGKDINTFISENQEYSLDKLNSLEKALPTKTISLTGKEYTLSYAVENPVKTGLLKNGEITSEGLKALEKAGIDNPIFENGKMTRYGVGDNTYDLEYDVQGNIIGDVSKTAAPFGWTSGSGMFFGHILEGFLWAGTVITVVQLLGGLLGMGDSFKEALTAGLAATAISMKTIAAIQGAAGGARVPGGTAGLGEMFFGKMNTAWIGWTSLAIGLVVFELTYSEESQEIVTFECLPWEAPSGGNKCEECNSGLYVCSEYRCKSLGQSCQLLNEDSSGDELCTWVNPKDVNSPIIQTWEDVLTKNHKYVKNTAVRPPDNGVKIINTERDDGCVKAFSPLVFGITTNEPAQCKIDYNRTDSFEEMTYYMGGSSIYKYNHSQVLSLPSPTHITDNAGPEIKADGNYNLYVRCRDGSQGKDGKGNANDDLFVFSFCVEKGPDLTPPSIEATSISNDMPVQYGLNDTPLEVYLNEPAECKWSRTDIIYDEMETTMICSKNIWEMNNLLLYRCKTTLTGLQDRKDNDYFIRCKDQPWLTGSSENDRNVMQDSYKLTLKGTQPLVIVDVGPNGTIKSTATTAPVFLKVKTDHGYNNGDAWCSYSPTQDEKDYIQMKETGEKNKHEQRLDLPEGQYTYYYQCVDLGGNAAYNKTTFTVEIDKTPPVVVRAYKESGKLKIVTVENSDCRYDTRSCNYRFEDGINMPYSNQTYHVAEWKTDTTYFIKCADEYGNQPNPSQCSVVVRPYDMI